MRADFFRLEAELSASDGRARRPKRSNHLVRCDLLSSVTAPNRADRSFFCRARISPDPVHELSPLFHWAQDCVVCPTVDHRLMFVVIFLHFERHCNTVRELQIFGWCRNKAPVLEEPDVAKPEKLGTFHFPSRNLQVLARTTGKEARANS